MKPRPIASGWCQSDHHDRCPHQLQTATDRRRDIWCACPCHTRKDQLFQ